MKTIKIYFLVVFAGIFLNGCYDLDTYPGDELNQGLFWKTDTHVKQGLMGVYSRLKDVNVFGYYFSYDILGGIAYQTEINTEFANGTYTSRSAYVQYKWQYTYDGIQRANHFIRSVSAVTFLDDAAKAEFIAEAKFLRALYYFHLLDFYGGVPYYDETTDVNVEYTTMKKPRSTPDEIRAHIISDLDEAIAKLRVAWSDAEYGRATKGAAYALRGKVHLYSKQWKSAIADFEEVVNNKSNNYGYALDPDYARLFKLHADAKSNEMVFTIQNKGGTGTEYGMKYTIWLGSRASIKNGGWNACTPATDFVDMYECPDGKPFNWEDVFAGYNTTPVENGARSAKRQEYLSVLMDGNGAIIGEGTADRAKILSAYTNRDPRLMMSVIVPYSIYKGWMTETQLGDVTFALDHLKQGHQSRGTMRNEFGGRGYVTYFFRKFVEDNTIGTAMFDRDHSPFQFPIIRYADVLLMLAEAYNEDNQLNKAVTELNKVRARANMPGLNSGAAWLAVSTKDEMTARIRKERAIELCAEGHRFSDMRRWGWDVAKSIAKDAVSIYGDYLYSHKFTERDMLWPVPDVEIERNEALKPNNPGW